MAQFTLCFLLVVLTCFTTAPLALSKIDKSIALAQSGDNTLTPKNCVFLLVDHQTGLLQLVRDYSVAEFKNNVLALGAIAKAFDIPTILTTSFEQGPNGPLLPELKEMFPDAPYIARPGQINAWDNEDFVKAVKATGRKKIVIAGIVTDVCVAFPSLSALAEGFEVYMVVDASGTFNTAVRDAALDRAVAAGAIPINWFAVAGELQKDWRNDGDKLMGLMTQHVHSYANLVTSMEAGKAQAAKAETCKSE
jgi:nicotinamidase-related amidase